MGLSSYKAFLSLLLKHEWGKEECPLNELPELLSLEHSKYNVKHLLFPSIGHLVALDKNQ